MRRLTLLAAMAAFIVIPAAAQDLTEPLEEGYPLRVETSVRLTGDFLLKVTVTSESPNGFTFFRVSDETGTFTGTGERLSVAMKSLERAYLASGLRDDRQPAFLQEIFRVDGNLGNETTQGEGLDSVRRITLAPFSGMTFVIPAWVEPSGPENFEENGNKVMLKFVPLATPGEMLVTSTRADEDTLY